MPVHTVTPLFSLLYYGKKAKSSCVLFNFYSFVIYNKKTIPYNRRKKQGATAMYIPEQDLNYIKNKHHQLDKPYYGNKHYGGTRYICNPDIFDPATGIDPELTPDGIIANDLKYKHLSHKIRKARALEFVLENTRISCDPRDRFPAI